jgi:hypothetical protein
MLIFEQHDTTWREVGERLRDESNVLHSDDKLQVFEQYRRELQEKERERANLERERRRVMERKQRDEFRSICDDLLAQVFYSLLQSLVFPILVADQNWFCYDLQCLFHSKTAWSDIEPILLANSAYRKLTTAPFDEEVC